MVFDGVDIRPGKPLVFGVIDSQTDEGRRIPFFGLPGNPLSTLVTFELFVRPAIGLLLGRPEPATLATTGARLATDYAQRKLPLTVFVPAAFVPLRRGSGSFDGAAGRGQAGPVPGLGRPAIDGRRRRVDDRRARYHGSPGGVSGGRLAQMS